MEDPISSETYGKVLQVHQSGKARVRVSLNWEVVAEPAQISNPGHSSFKQGQLLHLNVSEGAITPLRCWIVR